MLDCIFCPFQCCIWIFGIFTFIQCCVGFAQFINKSFSIRKPHNLIERYGKGSWAVVTGATGGLGEAFCKELAELGFNIALISRNKARLEATEKYLNLSFPNVKTRIVQADFSESMTPDFYQNICRELDDLDISLLINNAGQYFSDYFGMILPQDTKNMILTNCSSYLFLTQNLLPNLKNREKRSGIISMSSISALSPNPYEGAFPATHNFVRFLSFMLHNMFNDKIDVLCASPGYILTKMINYKDGPDRCTPEVYAKAALRDLGYDVESSSYWVHAFEAHIIQMLYRFCKPVWLYLMAGDLESEILAEFYSKHAKLD